MTQQLNVLLVAEKPSTFAYVDRLRERYTLFHAECGELAKNTIATAPVDVLVISATLPDMSGEELAVHIANQPHGPSSILIHEYPDACNEACSLSGVEHLNWPVGEFTLMAAIDTAASRSPQ